jgi:hypothetical protein
MEAKKLNNEERRTNYRRLQNGLKRGTGNAKKRCLESLCDEIIEFQSGGCHILI